MVTEFSFFLNFKFTNWYSGSHIDRIILFDPGVFVHLRLCPIMKLNEMISTYNGRHLIIEIWVGCFTPSTCIYNHLILRIYQPCTNESVSIPLVLHRQKLLQWSLYHRSSSWSIFLLHHCSYCCFEFGDSSWMSWVEVTVFELVL